MISDRDKQSKYHLKDGTAISLGENVGEGGEGAVYRISIPGMVGKFYLAEKKDAIEERKLELLAQKRCESLGTHNLLSHYCLPNSLIYDSEENCVGFTMRYFNGVPLAELLLQETLTRYGWTRVQLVHLAIDITKSLRYLRLFDMLVGDINLYNILVSKTGDFAIIDTDSFQIGDRYVCKVGQLRFSSPRLEEAARLTGDTRRTIADENYALTTLLFHILMPEKWPFMSIDGRNEAQALRDRIFVFPQGYGDVNIMARGSERMWYDLPQSIRAAFCSVYNDGTDVSPEQWEVLLGDYLKQLETLQLTQTIFPLKKKEQDMPHLLTLPEREGESSEVGVYEVPRPNESELSSFAVIYFSSDSIVGMKANTWSRQTPKQIKRVAQTMLIQRGIFDRIDAEGRIDAARLADDLYNSAWRKEWYKHLAPMRPRVMRFYLMADSLLRNIVNGEEVVEQLRSKLGWTFNIPSFAQDNEMIAEYVLRDMSQGGSKSKTILYIDDKMSCRMLFYHGYELKRTLVLQDCGRHLMRNRFIYTSGGYRTPQMAWQEHEAACEDLAQKLDIPSEAPDDFFGAKMVIVGFRPPASVSQLITLEERAKSLDKDILTNRERMSDYTDDFLMSPVFTAEFEYRLGISLIKAVANRLQPKEVIDIEMQVDQIKILSSLKNQIL